jgi:hypothetical protein
VHTRRLTSGEAQAIIIEPRRRDFVYEMLETFDAELSVHELQTVVIERLPHWPTQLHALPLL